LRLSRVHACGVTAPVTPRPAATVVVIREARPGPFEVMLLRRSAAMSFVAGAHVFPGGTIDDADVLVEAAACCDGLEAPPRFPHLDLAGGLACRVAAARELVEEAGVLLARRHGTWASSDESEALRRVLDDGVSFEQALRDGGWRLALDALVPFAQIVTPGSEPRRFDTHFFLAKLPSGAEARPAAAESDELVWATVASALGGGLTGEVVLLPPTWVILMQLEAFDSAAAVLAWGRDRTIERLEPRLTVTAGARQITIPVAGKEVSFSFEEERGWRPVQAG
jgi:8-oxo-dGTP pyrophosphatase MutT (NUDIX family)